MVGGRETVCPDYWQSRLLAQTLSLSHWQSQTPACLSVHTFSPAPGRPGRRARAPSSAFKLQAGACACAQGPLYTYAGFGGRALALRVKRSRSPP